MSGPVIDEAGRRALRVEAARALRVGEGKLADLLAPLVEASPARWETTLGAHPTAAVAASMALSVGAVDGLARPHLLDVYDQTELYKRWRAELTQRQPDRALGLESVLRRLFEHVPRLADLYEARRLLDLAYCGRTPSSLASLLDLLGVPTLLLVDGREISALDAARLVREEFDTKHLGFTRALVRAGDIPPVIDALVTAIASRDSERASLRPVRLLAGLAPTAAALLVYCAPRTLPTLKTVEAAVRHFARLARVLGDVADPTLAPRRELLGRIRVEEEVARRFDDALLEDAEEIAEGLVEDEDCDESSAHENASRSVMAGFSTFRTWLGRAGELGAPITAVPRGIAVPRRSRHAYQGVREDLAPRPEIMRQLLSACPRLVTNEGDRHLIVIQMLSAARASVVLSLERRYVVEVDDGLMIHVPTAGNKTGRSVLFIARAFCDLYGIDRSWFPESAPEDPPQYRRDELAGALERLCTAFEAETGVVVARSSARFTRSAIAQLLRPHLDGGPYRAVMSAQLGQKIEATRASYWRAWPEEIARSLAEMSFPGRGDT